MDIAVLSDIHGNIEAFNTCLQYIENRGIDKYIFLGDYLGEFAYPQKTMEKLYELRNNHECYFVKGNKEEYWLNAKVSGAINNKWKDYSSSSGCLVYNYRNLTEKDFGFYESLPIYDVIKIPNHEEIMICHGSHNSTKQHLYADKKETDEIVKDVDQKTILCGHIHVQSEYKGEKHIIINPGAVGVSYQSGGKAQFSILHSDGYSWINEPISIVYDKEKAIDQLRVEGLFEHAPYWTKITEHLITKNTVMHVHVLMKAVDICREKTGDCDWSDIPEEYWKEACEIMLK